MNKNEKMELIVAATAFGLSVYGYVKTIQKERVKRQKIASKLDKDLLALSTAKMKVEQKIMNGEYDRKSLDTMLTDFEFEYIIEANKD